MLLRPAFWVGVGAVVVYEFFPEIVKAVRPAVVQTIKTGLAVADQMKVSGGEAKETFGDLFAEAKAEYQAEKEASDGAARKGTSARRNGSSKRGRK